jgi:ATP-dependent helicase HrpB
VVATNVAETSLTIEGIRLVVDSGLARVPRFDPYRGIDTLLIETISRASADQRAGRAGRTAPGRCLRLWTEAEHRERPRQTAPEIQRVDLAETVLALKAGGTGGTAEPATGDPLADVRAFPWLDPPGDRQLERAGRLLTDLGAMDARTGALTPLGRQLAAFPAHPRFARMLLAAAARGCVRPAAFIAALTQERGLLVRRPDDVARELRELRLPDEAESDFFHLRHAWEYARDAGYDGAACRRIGIHPAAARRVEQNFEYFLRLAREEGLDTAEGESGREALQQCILAGFADQLARRADRHSLRCLLVHERRGTLSRESVVRGSPLLVAAEVRELETRGGVLEVVLSLCTAVRRDWLETLYPGDLRVVREVAFDPAAKRVVARENRYFRDLLLDSGPPGLPAADEAARLLADAMLRGTLALKHWNHALEQWIERVNLVAGRCPELGIPPIDEAATRHLLEQVCHGGFGLKDVRERPVLPVFRSWLAPEQQAQVERLAPERVALPNGRTPKVVYGRASPPHIALRIQELYGVEGRVTIAGGRVPLRIHVLAPNQRPVQITEDLAGFWRDHYPRVKQELRRKYPRHEWR